MIEITFSELIFWIVGQALVFWLFFGGFLKGLKSLKLWGPVLMWKSKKGLALLDKIANKSPSIWKFYADLGIILAFGFLGALFVFREKHPWKRLLLSFILPILLFAPFSFTSSPLVPEVVVKLIPFVLFLFGFSVMLTLFLFSSAASIIVNGLILHQPVMAGAAPAIPGVYVKGSFLFIPWYGWFAFPILIFVHEMSHGILARIAKIKVKEAGLMFFGFIPLGAFVEPDDKQLESAPVIPKLRVLAAGSMANYTTAVILTLLLIPVPFILQVSNIDFTKYYDHPVIRNLDENTSICEKMGKFLDGGIKLLAINGNETRTTDDVVKIVKSLNPGENVTLYTDKGNFTVTLTNDSRLGIRMEQGYKPMPLHVQICWYLMKFIGLVVFFNLIIGVMNLLPLYPLDGGLMLESILQLRLGKRAKTLIKLLAYLMVLMLLINISPLFFVSGGGGCLVK